MAFTKINAAGIGTTETVTVDGLTVINDGSFGGNLTVSGVLTYEDVTNVDSVGLITARNGIVVGSGITLSKDGDIFATGITTVSGNVKVGTGITLSPDGDVFFTGVGTGNGSGLTALNASNLGSGTVPTARLGSGTASSSTFLRGDSTFQTVSTDLVDDTTPQLGGNLDVNTKNIVFGDSGGATDDRLTFGAGTDLSIYHTGNASFIDNNNSNNLFVRALSGTVYYDANAHYMRNAGGTENMLKATADGGVQLYYDNSTKLETISTGIRMQNTSEFTVNGGTIQFGHSSSSDDRLKFGANDTDLQIFHGGNGQFDVNTGDVIIRNTGDFSSSREIYLMARVDEQSVTCFSDGSVELYYDNALQVKTVSDGIQLQTDKFISRHPNSNTQIIEVTNAQYAKSIYFGGWDGGTNSSGISRVRNSNDNLHIDAGSGGTLYLMAYSDNVTMCRHFRPMSDDTYDLGGGGVRWDDVFATNGTINTSDRTLKNTIVDSDLGLSFINKLKPVSYKFNGKTRTHYGLIAQDVETVLSDISKPSTDFAGFIKTDLPDEYYQEAEPHIPEGKKEGDLKSAAHTEYGLRYTEFISPLIKAVQELSAKNDALEARIAALEG